MKQTGSILALVLMISLQSGCTATHETSPKGPPDDLMRVFVGTWEGQYVNDEGRLVRTWIQKRSADGTFVIDFVLYTKQGLRRIQREGTWWIEGGRFYEIAPEVAKKPAEYRYEILNEDEIRFSSVLTDYAFTDKRVQGSRRP